MRIEMISSTAWSRLIRMFLHILTVFETWLSKLHLFLFFELHFELTFDNTTCVYMYNKLYVKFTLFSLCTLYQILSLHSFCMSYNGCCPKELKALSNLTGHKSSSRLSEYWSHQVQWVILVVLQAYTVMAPEWSYVCYVSERSDYRQ